MCVRGLDKFVSLLVLCLHLACFLLVSRGLLVGFDHVGPPDSLAASTRRTIPNTRYRERERERERREKIRENNQLRDSFFAPNRDPFWSSEPVRTDGRTDGRPEAKLFPKWTP